MLSIDISQNDRAILKQCVIAAADGPFFDDYVFPSLFPQNRDALRSAADEIERVGEITHSACTAVTSSLNNSKSAGAIQVFLRQLTERLMFVSLRNQASGWMAPPNPLDDDQFEPMPAGDNTFHNRKANHIGDLLELSERQRRLLHDEIHKRLLKNHTLDDVLKRVTVESCVWFEV